MAKRPVSPHGATLPFLAKYCGLRSRQGSPHRARLNFHEPIVQDRHQGLRLPVAVEKRHAGKPNPRRHHLGIDRFSGVHGQPRVSGLRSRSFRLRICRISVAAAQKTVTPYRSTSCIRFSGSNGPS